MNTLEKGTFGFVVIKWGNGYLGICNELGFVEEWDTPDLVMKHLLDGAIATLKAVKTEPRLLPSLNTRPPFKYLIIFYLAPLLSYVGQVYSIFSRDTRTLAYA